MSGRGSREGKRRKAEGEEDGRQRRGRKSVQSSQPSVSLLSSAFRVAFGCLADSAPPFSVVSSLIRGGAFGIRLARPCPTTSFTSTPRRSAPPTTPGGGTKNTRWA